MDQTKYIKDDQFVCALDGTTHLKLVPHVYREEMYVGQEFALRDEIKKANRYYKADPNESPLNLFRPDLSAYPNFRFVENMYTVNLGPGDCIFLPAFYFY